MRWSSTNELRTEWDKKIKISTTTSVRMNEWVNWMKTRPGMNNKCGLWVWKWMNAIWECWRWYWTVKKGFSIRCSVHTVRTRVDFLWFDYGESRCSNWCKFHWRHTAWWSPTANSFVYGGAALLYTQYNELISTVFSKQQLLVVVRYLHGFEHK